MKKVLVKFNTQVGKYNKGETAGFDPETAKGFEGAKVGKIVGEAKATTDLAVTVTADTAEVQKMIVEAETEFERKHDELTTRADELDAADEQLKERAIDLDAREQKIAEREKATADVAKVDEKAKKDEGGKPPAQGAAK